jgi:hypothetical protein
MGENWRAQALRPRRLRHQRPRARPEGILRGCERAISDAAGDWRQPPAIHRADAPYCLSYTATLVTFLPAAFIMWVVSVRVLLSAENSTLPVTSVLPPFPLVSA